MINITKSISIIIDFYRNLIVQSYRITRTKNKNATENNKLDFQRKILRLVKTAFEHTYDNQTLMIKYNLTK